MNRFSFFNRSTIVLILLFLAALVLGGGYWNQYMRPEQSAVYSELLEIESSATDNCELIGLVRESEIPTSHIILHITNHEEMLKIPQNLFKGKLIWFTSPFYSVSTEVMVAKKDSDWNVYWYGDKLEIPRNPGDYFYQMNIQGDELSLVAYSTDGTSKQLNWGETDSVILKACL